jgi:perosamine synthetase
MGGHFYEMVALGFNYRITDFQCALGISQLKKLPRWIKRRNEIAAKYDEAFADFADATPLRTSRDVVNAYHLYVVKLSDEVDRDRVFRELRGNGIGVNVHYIPTHLHPYYRALKGSMEFQSSALADSPISGASSSHHSSNKEFSHCPVAEEAYKHIISLPMFPAMSDDDVDEVTVRLRDACSAVSPKANKF